MEGTVSNLCGSSGLERWNLPVSPAALPARAENLFFEGAVVPSPAFGAVPSLSWWLGCAVELLPRLLGIYPAATLNMPLFFPCEAVWALSASEATSCVGLF